MAMSEHVTFQDVIRCSVCDEEVGQLHCDTCQVYICQICAGTHITSDLSKKHEIVECRKRSKIKLNECYTHPTEKCELHCRQCSIPVCSMCMASAHVRHTVIHILDFCKLTQEEIKKESKEIEVSKISVLEKSILDLKAQIEDLPKKYDAISTEIVKYGDERHKQIDVIVHQYTSQVEMMKQTDLRSLNEQKKKLEGMLSRYRRILEENMQTLQSTQMTSYDSYKPRIHTFKDFPLGAEIKLPVFVPLKVDDEEIYKSFGSLQSSRLELNDARSNVQDVPFTSLSLKTPSGRHAIRVKKSAYQYKQKKEGKLKLGALKTEHTCQWEKSTTNVIGQMLLECCECEEMFKNIPKYKCSICGITKTVCKFCIPFLESFK